MVLFLCDYTITNDEVKSEKGIITADLAKKLGRVIFKTLF